MAEDRKFPLWKKIAIAAPFGVTTSVALHKMLSGKGVSLTGPFKPSVSSALDALGGLPTQIPIDMGFLRERQAFFTTDIGAEVARTAWTEAVRSTDPLSKEILNFAGDLKQAEFSEVYSSIEQTLQRHNSLFMGRTYSKFRSNVVALERHISQFGGPLGFTTVEYLSFPPPRNIAINKLPKEFGKFYSAFTKDTGIVGTGVRYYSRREFKRFGEYVFGFQYKDMPFEVSVPVSKRGILIEGLTQSSRRIAPVTKLWDPGSRKFVQTMSRHEFFMTDVEKSILPGILSGEYKTEFEIEKAISAAYEKNVHSLEHVPNLPPGVTDPAVASRNRIRGLHTVDVRVADPMIKKMPGESYTSIFREPLEQEFNEIWAEGKFTPFTSGKNLSAGRYSTFQAQEWSMFPEDVDWSREPRKALREYRATPKAIRAMEMAGTAKWSVFETPAWQRDFGKHVAPWLPTVYIDPKQHASILQKLGMKEGESLIASDPLFMEQLETSRVLNKPLKTYRADLPWLIKHGIELPSDLLIGWTPEGQPFTSHGRIEPLGLMDAETTARGQYESLTYRETYSPQTAEKYFHGFKGLQKRISPDVLGAPISKITGEKALRSGMFQLVSMDELVKDRSKLLTQITTGLYQFLTEKRDSAFTQGNAYLSAFMKDPQVFVSSLRRQAGSSEMFMNWMMKMGIRDVRMTPKEFGGIFGAVPSAVGEEKVAGWLGELAPEYMPHLKGVSTGLAQAVYAGPAELTGAGALGSMEPRMYELLTAGQYGPLGQKMADDLMRRAGASNPRTLAIHEALTKTLGSLTGRFQFPEGLGEWDVPTKGYSSEEFQAFIAKGGGKLKLGSGLRDVFVPGGDVLAPYMTPSGKVVQGDLAGEYHNYTRKIAELYQHSKRIDLDSASKIRQSFLENISFHQAPFGKGMGAVARTPQGLLGSSYLRAVSEYEGIRAPDIRTGLISKQRAARLFEDLRSSGLYSEEKIASMQQKMRSGKTIGSLFARHPMTGMYSPQPLGLRVHRGLPNELMVIPSITTKVAGKQIELSPMIGAVGDYDADIVLSSLMDPDVEKQIRKDFVFANNEQTRAYMEHQVRWQLIQAKAPKGEALAETTTLKQLADAKKLATTQEWVPKISIQLSDVRRAVSANLEGQAAADAMMGAQWLEQVPISGRHLSGRRVAEGEMSSLFRTVESAFKARDPERLAAAWQGILRESDDLSKALIEKDLDISADAARIRKISNVKSFRNVLPGLNIESVSRDMISALEASDASSLGDMARMAAGRKTPKMATLDKYLSYAGRLAAPEGMMSNVSEALMTAKNKMGALGLGLLDHKRMIGFGFLGSLAIAAAVSKPADLVGPGADIIPSAGPTREMKGAAARMRPEDVLPPEAPLGAPSAPSRITTPTARVLPGYPSRFTNVRARAGTEFNAQRFANVMAGRTGSGTVNINVRNSSSLHESNVIDKILR